LEGVTLLSLDVDGRVTLTLHASEAALVPARYGGYTLVDVPSGCRVGWSLDDGDGEVTIRVVIGGAEHEVRVEGGGFAIDFSSLRCLLRNPVAVQVQGTTLLEEGKIIDGRRVSGKNVTISGYTSFQATVSTVDLHFENFSIDGAYSISQPSVGPSFEEWLLPWPSILLSPLHIMWVASLALGVAGCYLFRRYRFRGFPIGRRGQERRKPGGL